MMPFSWHMIGNTLLMAPREIRRNKLRSSLTTLGIVIGVGAVIALVTLGEGATARVTNDIARMGTNMLTVMPGSRRNGPAQASASPLSLDDVKAIQQIRGIAAVAPSGGRSVLAVYANKNWNTVATGTTNDYYTVRASKIATGRLFSDVELSSGLPVCAIGATVQRELFGHQDPLGAQVRIGRLSCLVVATIESDGPGLIRGVTQRATGAEVGANATGDAAALAAARTFKVF